MDDLKMKVCQYIDGHKDELVEFLQEMVRFDSVYLKEEGIQNYLADCFKRAGWKVDLWKPNLDEVSGHEAYSGKRENFETSPLLVGTINGSGGGKSLILNGHIDVVPEGDNWNYKPYEGIIEDGRIIGRGANDMKGGLAAGIMALKFLSEMGIKLKGDVMIESVIDEEVGSAGSLAVALRGYKADGAIIPEPSKYAVVPACQGSTFFRISVPGKTAHGAYHYLGINAIKKAQFLMDKLDELEEKRQKEFFNDLFSCYPIQCPIAVGKLNSGAWPSMSPDLAVFEGRYGVTYKETVAEAKAYFMDFMERAWQEDEWLKENPPKVEWLEFWNSGITDIEHEIVKTAVRIHEEFEGKKPEVKGYAAPVDLAILTRYADTPTIVYGPGNDSLHQSDEYIEIDDIVKYAKHFSAIVMDWCSVEE